MRQHWRRLAPILTLGLADVARLVEPVTRMRVIHARPIGGGLVNTNVEVTLDGPPGRVRLRLLHGDPAILGKEAAIARRLAGSVPVPRFLHRADTNPVTGHAFAVLEWIDGIDLATALAGSDPAGRAGLGAAVGAALARIHAVRFAHPGFLSASLQPGEEIAFGGAALVAFLRDTLHDTPAGTRLGPALVADLLAFAESAGARLDAWPAGACLVHGDLNPTNLLLCRAGAPWRLAAVLDWEFALAATPALDVGTLLRAPLDGDAAFTAAFAEAYRTAGGCLPDNWRALARLADLFAWADMLRHRSDDPALLADARDAVRAVLASR